MRCGFENLLSLQTLDLRDMVQVSRKKEHEFSRANELKGFLRVVSSASKVQAGTNADIGFGSLLKVEPKAKSENVDLLFHLPVSKLLHE